MNDIASDAPGPVSPTPSLRWMLGSLDRVVALGFGSGLIRPAPGTWGTLFAWLVWSVGLSRLPDVSIAILLPVLFAYGCWACDRAGKALGRPDAGCMVWDECVAFWLVLWLTPSTIWAQAVAFAVFRFFDILKPPPVRYFDARLKNGFGVMWDDLLAAGYSLLVMAILVRFGAFL